MAYPEFLIKQIQVNKSLKRPTISTFSNETIRDVFAQISIDFFRFLYKYRQILYKYLPNNTWLHPKVYVIFTGDNI